MKQRVLPLVGRTLVDLLFPPCCSGCGARLAAGILCQACAPHIERISSPRCPVCGVPFAGVGPDHWCQSCLSKPPAMDSTWPTFVYGGPLAQGLRALKYGPRPERLGGLAQLWCDESPPLPRVDLALPVPLHPRRLRERGFNQVVLLARPLMRKEGITMDYNMLHRRKGGPHQASLPEKERRLAARKAFSLSPRAANLRGLHVLVVDDVMTTGATADACAALVRQAGARQVHVAVLARAPRML